MLLERNTPVIPGLHFEHASISHGADFGMAQRVIDAHKETLESGLSSVRLIIKAGGRIGMGGDFGYAWNPHGNYAKELTFFVKVVGLTALETITCATRTGAEILGRDREIGTLETGKLADVLVVSGDVLADISILEDHGRVHRGAARRGGQGGAEVYPFIDCQIYKTQCTAMWDTLAMRIVGHENKRFRQGTRTIAAFGSRVTRFRRQKRPAQVAGSF